MDSSKNSFCTLITANYLPWALALNHSLLKQNNEVIFYILVVDADQISTGYLDNLKSTHLLFLKDIDEDARPIIDKYLMQPDELRWSLKPALMQHLLKQYDKVICCDCDLYFYSSYQFLFDELDNNDIIVTPHNRPNLPGDSEFRFLYTHGLYNGGFVGASKNGRHILDWWSALCLHHCACEPAKGYFVDQRYLDALPVYFNRVGIIKHKGCNLAYWNYEICKRTPERGIDKMINGKYPVVFIHFSNRTLMCISNGTDGLPVEYAQEFSKALSDFGWKNDIIEGEKTKARKVSFWAKLKYKVSLTRRINRFINLNYN